MLPTTVALQALQFKLALAALQASTQASTITRPNKNCTHATRALGAPRPALTMELLVGALVHCQLTPRIIQIATPPGLCLDLGRHCVAFADTLNLAALVNHLYQDRVLAAIVHQSTAGPQFMKKKPRPVSGTGRPTVILRARKSSTLFS